VRLGEEGVVEAVQLPGRRPFDETVGQEVERARVGLLGHGLAVDVGPVLPPLADHDVGALAQEAVLDAGEDPGDVAHLQEGVGRPVGLLRRAAGPLQSEPDLEGEARVLVGDGVGDALQILRHALAQTGVAGAVTLEALDLLARIGLGEGLPEALDGVGAAVGEAVGLAAAGAGGHHVRVLAGGGPPGGPLRLGDDAAQRLADLAGGERPVVALERDPQQLLRHQGGEALGVLQLAAQDMVRRQRLEQLGRGLEADGHTLDALEVDLEALETEIGFGDAAHALALHGHDGADVEGEEALELLHLLPGLRDVVGGALEAHGFGEPLEDGAVAVQALQGGKDGGVELFGGEEDASGLLQKLSSDVPAPALAELVVQHLEEEAGALLLTGAGQGAGDADEVIQVGWVPAHGGKPFSLDRFKLSLCEVLLYIS
jgi:hypothetical protein